jgi:hypothetical protein
MIGIMMIGITMLKVSQRSEAEAYHSLKNNGSEEEYHSSTSSSFCDGCKKAKTMDDLGAESGWSF